ncbi:hypothetical protein [Vibrio sp. dhg]|uniref:hypothetical protein n=1 Tax=Vibrio sp. dhg TaxID=2163016 RepID=UPI000E47F542|nr:hypothetical protein [Vibrio sp. dhg]AXT72434.1 hypothetical protein DBX26_15730 [Vibrio sp. dhg]
MKHKSEKAHYDVLETQYEREFLTLMHKDVEENSQNLSFVTPALEQELEEIIGDYKIDLGAKHTSIRF